MNNFTPRAQQVLALSRKEADRLNHNYVGTEHLLLGLVRLGQGTAVNVLQKLGVDLETIRLEVEEQVRSGPDARMSGNTPYTPRVKKVLALAGKESKALSHSYVGTEHLLLGLLREGDGVAARVLRTLDVDLERTREAILKELDPNIILDPNAPAYQEINRIQKELSSLEDQRRNLEKEIASVRFSGGERLEITHADLQSHLASGERLLWSGIPQRKFRFERRHLPLLFFGLPFLAALLLSIIGVLSNAGPSDKAKPEAAKPSTVSTPNSPPPQKETMAGRIMGTVFVIVFFGGFIGFILTMAGRPSFDRFLLKRTIYGVTQQRLIIITGTDRKRRIRSLLLYSVSDVRMEEWPNGLGTISFGDRLAWPYSKGSAERFPAIEHIPEPQKVFQIIAEIRKPV